ncbi:MAG TPA: ankyrin repeat domain-containing protein [Solirubrobacteraceae bacterium]|jgi:ankyrin repeat protein
MSKSLPRRPDLRWLRDEAKTRRRNGEFPSLALAHLAIAREYGFVSWPRLKAHVDALTLDAAQRAAILIASACSDNHRRAATILELDPAIARHDLASACVAGEADEVARLLRAHPDAAHEPLGPNGWRPLLYACFSRLLRTDAKRAAGIRAVVAALLTAGADPNASFMHGDWLQAPIYGAAGIAGDAELTALLLAAGADPNDAGSDHTVGEALYHACEHRDPTCARLLIEAGTDIDVVQYCLGRALNFDNHAMVAMFCSQRVRPWATHLHQALWRRRSLETVAALLDAGAPLEEPDEHGLTPLQIALLWGDGPVAALLRKRSVSEAAGVPGDAAAAPALLDEMVILAVQRGDLATVRELLDAGARVDGDPDGAENPLGQACWRAQVPIVEELLARGAASEFSDGGCAIGAALHGSRHCQDSEGGPTMATIAEIDPKPYAEIVRMLLAAGARVPQRVGGEHGPRAVTLLGELGIGLEELPESL